MSSDALLFITEFPKIIWHLFTDVKIPGLNFSPGIFFFGILTFSVIFKFVLSILHITSFFGHPDDKPPASRIAGIRNSSPYDSHGYPRN